MKQCRFRRQEVGAKLVAQVEVKKFNLTKDAKGKVFPSTRLKQEKPHNCFYGEEPKH